MTIDTSVLVGNAEKLNECIKKNNEREQRQVVKDTQPHELVKAKTTKKTKGMLKKILHPLRSIKNRDKTLKRCRQLMMEGADRSEFKLPEEYLQNLLPKQKMCYDAFSKKLDIIAEHIRALQSQNSRYQSNDSIADNGAYESGYESNDEKKDNDIDEERLTNLSQKPFCKPTKSGSQEPQSKDKTCVSPVNITKSNLAPRENNQNSLLEAIQKRNYKKITTCLKNGSDITVKDTNGNNILHFIVELAGKQKVESLEFIVDLVEQEVISQEKLGESIKAINNNGHTPIQSMLIKKITKKRHNREEVGENDNTLKFIAKLLELGADPHQLTLPEETYQNLNKEQLAYCQQFREKLTKIAENTVNTQDNNDNYLLHSAIVKKNKDLFEKLLQRGADITKQDANGNNALHYIAELEGKQKVEYLQSILYIVEKNTLEKAVNTANEKGNTPIRVALEIKARKEKIEYLKVGTVIFDSKTIYDNTTKFCATLLESCVDLSCLELEERKFHTKRYYLTLRDLKDYKGTPSHAQEKIKELKGWLEREYEIKTFSKKCMHIQKKTWSATKKAGAFVKKAGSAIVRYVDPVKRTSQLLAITIAATVITMTAIAFFQGQMAIEAAIPIIVVAGICLTLALCFSTMKKFMKNFERFSFNEVNYNYQYREQEGEISERNSHDGEKNLANNPREQKMQNLSEHRETPSTQPKHGGIPDTTMDTIKVGRLVPTHCPSP